MAQRAKENSDEPVPMLLKKPNKEEVMSEQITREERRVTSKRKIRIPPNSDDRV